MTEASGVERREIHYRGRVQGVGFRYTVRQIAQRFRVLGYVQNLLDGRVKIVVEGEASELDRFLSGVADAMTGYIHDSSQLHAAATGEFKTFTIEH